MARRILKEIRLERIAAVDRPCQEGAVVTILKRAPEGGAGIDEAMAKRIAALREKLMLAKAGIAMVGSIGLRKAMEKSSPVAEARYHKPADEMVAEGKVKGVKHDQQVKKDRRGRSAGRARVGDRAERRGEHLGPYRPPSRFKRPRRSLRFQHGPRRQRHIHERDVQTARTGPRQLPGSERKMLLARRKLRHKHHLYSQQKEPRIGKAVILAGKMSDGIKKPRKRRELKKDALGRIASVVSKSAIILAQLPDESLLTHVEKVLGNTAKDYIDDFVHSANPKFAGKSKEDRIRMALGAFYGRK